MLVLISPAKTLDYTSPVSLKTHTLPRFMDESQELVDTLRAYSVKRVGKLMDLSEKLSALNVERYQSWKETFTTENARQAILAFKGDVYIGLDVSTLNKRDLNFAQKNVRILSGLYGVLRPLDLMQPYRLEMGTNLKNSRGNNLYAYWSDTITESLNEELGIGSSRLVINLASKEYFGAVDTDKLDGKLVSPVFLDEKKGDYKVIGFFAKKARGTMTRFIIKERMKSLNQLKEFNLDGYQYDEKRSTQHEPVFIRKENWTSAA